MRRLWPGLPLILVLESLALFGVAAPSWAHNGSAAQVSDASVADTARVIPDQATTPFPSTDPGALNAARPYLSDWQLFVVAARISIMLFLVLLATLHLTRYGAASKYTAWAPKITAFLCQLIV